MERQTLAQRIKQLRILSGFSQEELSERASLSLRTIQRIENGETQPRGYSLQRLAEVLGTTPADLLIAAAESAGVPVEAGERVGSAATSALNVAATDAAASAATGSANDGSRTNHGAAATSATTTSATTAKTPDNAYLVLLNLSGLAFLFGPGLGVITPLILWILKKDKVDGVKETGKRVINFQLTWALVTGLYWGIFIYQAYFHVQIVELPRGGVIMLFIALLPRFINIVYVVVNTFRVARNLRPRYVPSIPFFHPAS